MTATVKRITWAFGKSSERTPAIRIKTNYSFITVPITEARLLVDIVHDEMDRYDSEQRERERNK